jgi:flagellin
MALVVQTNTAAITALKHLNTNSANMNKSLERLSSGFRINNAADDAAGFAISSKLSAQTERLKAASNNATQAQAMVKMADAGINEIQNMVTRIQVLATQAASANNTAESGKLDAERLKLENAIDKIAKSTNYNGVHLLDGTGGGGSAFTTTFTQGTSNTGVSSATVTTASTTNLNATYQLDSLANGNVTIIDNRTGAGTATDFTVQFQANSTVSVNLDDGSKIDITFGAAPSGTASTTASTSGAVAVTGQANFAALAAGDAGAALASSTTVTGIAASVVSSTGTSENYVLSFANATGIVTVKSGANIIGTSAGFSSTVASNQTLTLADGDQIKITYDGTAFNGTGFVDGNVGTLTTGSNSSATQVFQVGAGTTTADQVSVNLSNSYTSSALGLGSGGLLNQTSALLYLDKAVIAMNTVITNRADLGATQNQLGFVNANLATSIEQGQAAVSSIRDADMAAEMANFTKNKVLVQATTAMLAQANQTAQNVLTLFR